MKNYALMLLAFSSTSLHLAAADTLMVNDFSDTCSAAGIIARAERLALSVNEKLTLIEIDEPQLRDGSRSSIDLLDQDALQKERGFAAGPGPITVCKEKMKNWYQSLWEGRRAFAPRRHVKNDGYFFYPLDVTMQRNRAVKAFCRCGNHSGHNVIFADGSVEHLDQKAFIQKLRGDAQQNGIAVEITTPTVEQGHAVAEAIQQLGDGDYDRREEAMQSLRELANVTCDQIVRGKSSDDAEIAARCAILLDEQVKCWNFDKLRQLFRRELKAADEAAQTDSPAAAPTSSSQK